MINFCIEEKKPFGVVLIQNGEEVGDPAAMPYEIRCIAQITYLHRLDEGRVNLLAVG